MCLSTDGAQVEHARYTSYGVPIGMPGADTDSDGDCDSTDITQIQTWIDAPSYDVRGDVDLDGDVDASDKSTAQGWLQGKTHGWEVLGSEGDRKGFGGYELIPPMESSSAWVARNRPLVASFGRWTRRDPLTYVDAMSLYEYVQSRPQWTDVYGLRTQLPGAGPGSSASGRPGTPEECQSLKEKMIAQMGGAPQGGTGCKDGEAIYCVFEPMDGDTSPGQEAVRACIMEHEKAHARQADCPQPGSGAVETPNNDLTTPANKWLGLEAEINCYRKDCSDCKQDPACENECFRKGQACSQQYIQSTLGGIMAAGWPIPVYGANRECEKPNPNYP